MTFPFLPQVDWAQQQVVKPREKRFVQSDPNVNYFNDPKWSNMWYIVSVPHWLVFRSFGQEKMVNAYSCFSAALQWQEQPVSLGDEYSGRLAKRIHRQKRGGHHIGWRHREEPPWPLSELCMCHAVICLKVQKDPLQPFVSAPTNQSSARQKEKWQERFRMMILRL